MSPWLGAVSRGRRTAAVALAAACAVLALAACDEMLTAPSVSRALVTAGPWVLESMERQASGSVRAPDTGRFTLQFDESGRLAVGADCNRCTGSYRIAANTVAIPALACTRALCRTAPFDAEYVAALQGESAVRIGDGVLTLSSPRATLRFTR